MEFLSKTNDYVLYMTIPATVLVLIISVAYSLRNILRIWNKGKPKPVENEGTDSVEKTIVDKETNETNTVSDRQAAGEPAVDPLQYCEHLQSEVKKARQRVAEKQIHQNLTAADLEREREMKRKQIEDIFKLMDQHSEKFGNSTKEDIQQQMKLYV